MIKIQDSKEFERLLKALSDDVVDAHIHYRMHENLVNAIEKYPIVIQQSNTFWTYTLQAHLNSSIYALFRVFDKNSNALHLHSWLVTIQENIHLFDEAAFCERLKSNPYVASLAQESRKPDATLLAEDISACSTSDPVVKRLTVLRGNRIAHRNAKAVVLAQDVSNEHALTFEDIRTLLERAKTLLNRYSQLFAASFYSTTVVGRDDYENIFKAVQEKVALNRREWGLSP